SRSRNRRAPAGFSGVPRRVPLAFCQSAPRPGPPDPVWRRCTPEHGGLRPPAADHPLTVTLMKFANTRLAMAWLHTWLGLFFGFVLMVCFFFGALSVFDREIDRWAIPETRFEP